MATEILVNDGGAPARILPYTAAVALNAGQAVMASTTVAYEVVLADTAVGLSVLGFALTNTDFKVIARRWLWNYSYRRTLESPDLIRR
mgnify:CR=1 FL=1